MAAWSGWTALYLLGSSGGTCKRNSQMKESSMAEEMTRREALVALTGSMVFLFTPSISESCSISSTGCLIESDEVQRLSSNRDFLQLNSINDVRREHMIMTTGDEDLDRALGRALIKLTRIFSVYPGIGFIDEGRHRNRNAFATNRTLVTNTWGTVLFGQKLFAYLMEQDRQGWAVLAVMAHEMGHIAQFRSGIYSTLMQGQSTVKRLELHADLLAGYFLGVRKREQPSISIFRAGTELYKIGDFDFNNPTHHGTPDERLDAAEAGFKMALSGRHFQEVFSRGAELILTQ